MGTNTKRDDLGVWDRPKMAGKWLENGQKSMKMIHKGTDDAIKIVKFEYRITKIFLPDGHSPAHY